MINGQNDQLVKNPVCEHTIRMLLSWRPSCTYDEEVIAGEISQCEIVHVGAKMSDSDSFNLQSAVKRL